MQSLGCPLLKVGRDAAKHEGIAKKGNSRAGAYYKDEAEMILRSPSTLSLYNPLSQTCRILFLKG